MRISEDRYARELQAIDIALRFIYHEARTQTIRAWTGLSSDRILSLYHTYVRDSPCYIPRHRGRAPYKVGYFTRTLRLTEESTVLACKLSLLGAVPPAPSGERQHNLLPDPERAYLICHGYDMYRAQVPGAQINFERALFLASCLIRGEHLLLDNCVDCGGLVLSEPYARGVKRCQICAVHSR
jgi:hypothetical protein